jgi:DNA-binding MarR family transcriptional regulator
MPTEVEPVESPCVCATLRMATRAVARVYDRALEPHGLRTTQYSILARLEVEGPASVGHLAARLAMDRTTLAREAAPLVRAGLVAAEPGEDRRRRVLALTPAGLGRLESARPAWRDAQRQVRVELGYDRVQGVLDELRALLGAARNAAS